MPAPGQALDSFHRRRASLASGKQISLALHLRHGTLTEGDRSVQFTSLF